MARQSVGNYDSSKAKSITQVVLQQHPDLCGVLGVWDIPDLGTASAIKEAGKQGKVFLSTNGGGNEYACKAIKDGRFDSYVSFDVPGQGRDLTNLVSAALAGQGSGRETGIAQNGLVHAAKNADQGLRRQASLLDGEDAAVLTIHGLPDRAFPMGSGSSRRRSRAGGFFWARVSRATHFTSRSSCSAPARPPARPVRWHVPPRPRSAEKPALRRTPAACPFPACKYGAYAAPSRR